MSEENKKIEGHNLDEKKNTIAQDNKLEQDDDDELLALAGTVKKKIEEKNAGESEEKKYSERDLEKVLSNFQKKFSKTREEDDEDFIDLLDPDAVKRKFVRIARLNNKFVVGLKDMNTDSYSDQPVYITNVEHPTKKGEYIPWATFICDDGTEEFYPYLTFMNRGVGVWAEVTEEKKEDVSEKFGVIDVKAMDDEDEWNMKKTGRKVLAKALKYRTTFVCKEIKGGKTLEVTEDVINKVEAPYSELKKFIEQK